MKKYLNQQDMKDRNSTNIFRLIRKKGPLTRRQIEAETGLSWGAVSNVTARLIELGYIRECKDPDSIIVTGLSDVGGTVAPAGRTPIYLEADDAYHYVIGMDINASGFRAVMMNLRGDAVETVCRAVGFSDGDTLMREICALTREILDAADGKSVLCIGIAMQGTVDAANGVSVRFPRCRDWENVPLASELEDRFGLPVFLEHDPNCTLYAHSVPSGVEEAILVRIDRGIGMAVMLGGRVFERLGAFELGHTVVHPAGAVCSCGKRGCLEAYASMTGVSDRAGIPFEVVASHAREGDETAAAYFADMADALTVSIVNAARLLNVREIVLCGEMLTYRDLFCDRLFRRAKEISGEPELHFSCTDVAGAALGGAMIALERFALRTE